MGLFSRTSVGRPEKGLFDFYDGEVRRLAAWAGRGRPRPSNAAGVHLLHQQAWQRLLHEASKRMGRGAVDPYLGPEQGDAWVSLLRKTTEWCGVAFDDAMLEYPWFLLEQRRFTWHQRFHTEYAADRLGRCAATSLLPGYELLGVLILTDQTLGTVTLRAPDDLLNRRVDFDRPTCTAIPLADLSDPEVEITADGFFVHVDADGTGWFEWQLPAEDASTQLLANLQHLVAG